MKCFKDELMQDTKSFLWTFGCRTYTHLLKHYVLLNWLKMTVLNC